MGNPALAQACDLIPGRSFLEVELPEVRAAVDSAGQQQNGNQLVGTHQGDYVARDFSGAISGDDVRISSSVGEVHGAALSYRFTGKLQGDKMSGALDMGEYLGAKWTATRHTFGGGQGGD